MEFIHDELVSARMPFDEPVYADDFKDFALLDSAVNRPFQTFGGEDLYDTVQHKAAALFHSIVSNHCFMNGNKRTALIAVDLLLAANGIVLLVSNTSMYELARRTASAAAEGRHANDILREICTVFSNGSIGREMLLQPPFSAVRHAEILFEENKAAGNTVRSDPRNNPPPSSR